MLIINKIQLTGRVGKMTPREYQDKRFVTMRIVIPDKYAKKDQQPNDVWLSVVVNGKTAEFVEKYVAVGDYIYVEGRLTDRTYTDIQGVSRTDYQVNASELQVVSQKKKEEGEQQAAPGQATQQQAENPHLQDLMDNNPDQDLPF